MNLKPKEKTLALSLWSIILIVAALWYFWPSPRTFAPAPVTFELSPELKPILQRVSVVSRSPSSIEISLTPRANYLKQLRGDTRLIQLGFELQGPGRGRYQGALSWHIKDTSSRALLQNPTHLKPQKIRLFIAH